MKQKQEPQLNRARNFESSFLTYPITDPTLAGTTFHLLSIGFDIQRAAFLARWRNPENFDTSGFIKAYGAVVRIDQKKVDKMPVRAIYKPVYVGTWFLEESQRPTGMLIDGWHRAKKAYDLESSHEMKAIVFSPIETMWIMHELNIYAEA